MDWRRLLLSGLIATSLVAAVPAVNAAVPTSGCSYWQQGSGCSGGAGVSIGNGAANTWAFDQFGGRPGNASGGSANGSPGAGGGGSAHPPTGRAAIPTTGCNEKYCWEAGPGTPTPEIADAGLPEVRIEDVASFAPAPATDKLEPASNIAVRRMPANFISSAREQVVAGTLLGRPVEVRFIPVLYTWDTGDGGRIESSTPGATWERLRKPEYSETRTSHTFEERGYYTVTPTVTYEAEFRFDGSPWIPATGTLPIQGEPREVRVVTVETRLVRGSCLEYPNDWGCE